MYRGKGNKYGAVKVEHNGIKFDSKLEFFFHQRLIANHIPFEFQVREVIQNKFRDPNDKGIREIAVVIDFVIQAKDFIWYIDTKGFLPDAQKIKYKMFKYNKFLNEVPYRFDMPSTQTQCLVLLEEVREVLFGGK